MDNVLVLIASPHYRSLETALISKAHAVLQGAGNARNLSRHAVEIQFSGPPQDVEDLMRCALEGAEVDFAVVPSRNRRKKLLIADMDSTMIGQECIDELGKRAGAGEKIIAITERAMRGELNFEGAVRERVGLMEGLPEIEIQAVIENDLTYTPGGRTLVQTMRAHGAFTALVSGGFTQFTNHVAEVCGFNENRANALVIEDGVLTGMVREPILGRDAKVQAVNEYTAALGISPDDVIAVGDGANDLGMLELAGMGVALHAKPAVREAAGIRIDHSGLEALLFLQGYSAPEFSD
ncbi:MAG: phosphoserine phosphatase SerB [Hyphomicrobiales bacterium]